MEICFSALGLPLAFTAARSRGHVLDTQPPWEFSKLLLGVFSASNSPPLPAGLVFLFHQLSILWSLSLLEGSDPSSHGHFKTVT